MPAYLSIGLVHLSCCMCIDVWMAMCIEMRLNMRVDVCRAVDRCIHMFMDLCMDMDRCIHMFMNMCIDMYGHVYRHVYAHVCRVLCGHE